jgi:thymidylate synthase (FAD)
VKVIYQHATLDAEYQIAFIARGSNPPNQDNPEFRKLFEYCLIKHEVPHWSPFQMADMCLQFETSLAVAAQVKRHWTMAINEPMDIQETSMRYMDPFDHGWGFQPLSFRTQNKKNRQSSEFPLSMEEAEQDVLDTALDAYFEQLSFIRTMLKAKGVANETIRMLYPMATTTRFFIKGSCRSWIHYFMQRLDIHTQLEHRQVVQEAYLYFKNIFPTVADICEKANWFDLSEMELENE